MVTLKRSLKLLKKLEKRGLTQEETDLVVQLFYQSRSLLVTLKNAEEKSLFLEKQRENELKKERIRILQEELKQLEGEK